MIRVMWVRALRHLESVNGECEIEEYDWQLSVQVVLVTLAVQWFGEVL